MGGDRGGAARGRELTRYERRRSGRRAALYAQGASMKLGPLQAINADVAQPMFRVGSGAARSLSMAPAATPLPVEPGLITLSESVAATWALAPQ